MADSRVESVNKKYEEQEKEVKRKLEATKTLKALKAQIAEYEEQMQDKPFEGTVRRTSEEYTEKLETRVGEAGEDAFRLNSEIQVSKKEVSKQELLSDIRHVERSIKTLDEMLEESKRDVTMDSKFIQSEKDKRTAELAELKKSLQELDKKEGEHQKDGENHKKDLLEEQAKYYTRAKMKFERLIQAAEANTAKDYVALNREGLSNEKRLEILKRLDGRREKISSYREAIALCNGQLAMVKSSMDELLSDSISKINEAIKRDVPPVKPTEEKPAEEKPTEEKPTEEKPAEEKPAEEKPTEEKPAEEKPTEEKPAEEKPAEEKSMKLIDGYQTYDMMAIWEKYTMKRKAFEIAEQVQPDEKISLFRKIRLFLPSRKYSNMAQQLIEAGKIQLPEDMIEYKENETEQEEKPVDTMEQYIVDDKTAEGLRKRAEQLREAAKRNEELAKKAEEAAKKAEEAARTGAKPEEKGERQ